VSKATILRVVFNALRLAVVPSFVGLMVLNAIVWVDLLRFLDRIPAGAALMVFLWCNVWAGVWLGRKVRKQLFPVITSNVVGHKRRYWTWGCWVTAVVGSVVFHVAIFSAVGQFLVVSDSPQRADIIWILGTLDERYAYGADLYEQGLSDTLIMSLGTRKVSLLFETDTIKTNKDAIRAYMLGRGIPEAQLSMVDAENTFEEASLAKAYILKHHVRSAIIVSSPEHMRRVEMIFKHLVGKRAHLTMAAVPLNQSKFKLSSWWKDRFSLGRVIYEYLSLIYYGFVYIVL